MCMKNLHIGCSDLCDRWTKVVDDIQKATILRDDHTPWGTACSNFFDDLPTVDVYLCHTLFTTKARVEISSIGRYIQVSWESPDVSPPVECVCLEIEPCDMIRPHHSDVRIVAIWGYGDPSRIASNRNAFDLSMCVDVDDAEIPATPVCDEDTFLVRGDSDVLGDSADHDRVCDREAFGVHFVNKAVIEALFWIAFIPSCSRKTASERFVIGDPGVTTSMRKGGLYG